MIIRMPCLAPTVVAVAIALLATPCHPAFGSDICRDSLDRAFTSLDTAADQFHTTYWLYQDVGAAGNHFHCRGAIVGSPGDEVAVHISEQWTENPHSGPTCIRATFDAAADVAWAGFYFMNGVLIGDEVEPRPNWGTYPNAGVDLTGATTLTFWARGEVGGEHVDFFVGGVGRDAETGLPNTPYPDSLARVPAHPHTFQLAREWQRFDISLAGLDLSYVLGGFGWVVGRDSNPDGAIFYLDDISFDKPRADEPRFVASYRTIPSSDDFDVIMRNVAFVYDNALALIAQLTRRTPEGSRRARLIADSFVYAHAHDRYYSDGRLRNAYKAGDLTLPPGWLPNGRPDTVAIPGWWDAQDNHWYEDERQVSTDTGNMAWAILSLTAFCDYLMETEGPAAAQPYLDTAVELGEWILDPAHCYDTRGAGGYTGGFLGWEPDPTRILWKSTEHNIDCYAAFTQLYQLTGDTIWQDAADHAASFVVSMWNPHGPHFWTGTLPDGVTPNTDVVPLDAQAWAVLALDPTRYASSLQWVIDNASVSFDDGGPAFAGFDFNTDRDGIWWEGTAHMALAFLASDRIPDALSVIDHLQYAQTFAPGGDGLGLVAATPGPLTTGFDWLYFRRLHIGATAWFALALSGHNPFLLDRLGFPDVCVHFWAWESIRATSAAGIVQGYNDGCYHPEWPISRDQMAVFISRSICTPTGEAGLVDYIPPETATFSDVATIYWAYKYIEYAAEHNIVTGYEGNLYQPTWEVTRGQMAVFVARALVTPSGDAAVLPGPPSPTFPDVTSTNAWSWCYDHVEQIAAQGVTQGYAYDGYYHPEYTCTRDMMAVYIQRAFHLPM